MTCERRPSPPRLAQGGAGAPWQCLDLALAAAREAGAKAIRDNEWRLSPADRLALAMQAADEAMEELGVGLSGSDGTREGPR
jgi:hypothetical protein